MASHVAQRALPEVPPAPPVGRMIDAGPERTFRCGAQPEVPAEIGRWRLSTGRTFTTSPTLADPHVHFRHISQRTGLHDFHDATIVLFRVNLRAQLRRHAVLLGRFRDEACFLHRVREGFFAVSMQSGTNGPDRCRRMVMIRRANHHGIDLPALLLQHFPIVGILARCGKLGGRAFQVVRVDIHQRHDVFVPQFFDIVGRAIGRANAGDTELVLRRARGGARQFTPHARREECGPGCCSLQEIASVDVSLRLHVWKPHKNVGAEERQGRQLESAGCWQVGSSLTAEDTAGNQVAAD